MVAKKHRKGPKGFADLGKRFEWTPADAHNLLCTNKKAASTEAERNLKELAQEYLTWFEKEPDKVHVFPDLGARFQFEFAKGVRDAAGLKTRLRTMVVLRPDFPVEESYVAQAEKLGLNKRGVVVHDHIEEGTTLRRISKAAGIPKSQIPVHKLELEQVQPSTSVPIAGAVSKIRVDNLFKKGIGPGRKATIKASEDHWLSPKHRAFVRRALRASGEATAREILKDQGKP